MRPFARFTLALFVAAQAAPLAGQTTVPGWRYTTKITFDSGDGTKHGSMIMRTQATGQSLRMDYLEMPTMPGAGAAEGMYMVMNDADSTMMTVMPLQHMVMIMGMNDMPGGRMPGF